MPEKRILLVEDDPDTQHVLGLVLQAEGYAVDRASAFADAMEHLRARPYGLAIVDWRIPGGDGLEVADAAADLGSKTILVSGYLLQMPAGRAERHETLMKPIRPSEIVNAAARALGECRD